MVAIFTGAGLGFERGSGSVVGAQGQIGSGALGTAGGTVAVNAATGSLTLQRTDEMLIGRGPDAAPSLTYAGGPNSPAFWSADHLRILMNLTGTANTAGSTITMSRGFNDRPVLTYDTGRGAYVYKEGGGSYDEVRYSNGVWSFVDGDTQTTEYYEAHTGGAFLRKRVVDRDGNEQTYTYNPGTAEISRITNADGGYMEMTYTLGRPNEITTYAAAGGTPQTRVRYQWDPAVSSRLLSVTVDLSPEDNSIADGKTYVTTYGYENGTSRRITSITQTDGSSLDIGYDSSGRVTTLTELVAAGVTRVTTLAYHTGYTAVTDAQGGVTTLRYDERNQLVQITLPPASAGAHAQTTAFAYNANGDVVSVTDSTGAVTTFRYDSNGNQIAKEDSLGNIVARTYGSRNELLTETLYEPSPLAFVTSGATPTITGDKILGSVDNVCSNAISVQSYTGGAVVAGRRYHPANGYTLLGLTDGLTTPASPNADYDYAFYFFENRILISENGAIVGEPVTSGASDNHYCQIEYDGAKVFYRINGVVVREVAAASGRTFHAGVSTAWSNRGVQAVTFASSTPPLSFATTGPALAITPGKIVGTSTAWATATSVQSHTGSAYVAGRRHHPAIGYSQLGLTDKNGAELDYSFYFYEGSVFFFENGAIVGTAIANTATDNDFCQIEYNGTKVTYRVNGAVVREVTTSAGRTFHGGVAALYADRGVQDFVFTSALPVRAYTSTGPALTIQNGKVLATGWPWGSVVSPDAYTGSAYIAARRHHPDIGYSIFGLTDMSGSTEFDYSFYFYENHILLFENGAIVGTAVQNNATDHHYCQIEYDGAKVIYRVNGGIVREVATSGGRTFHSGVSALYQGRGVQDVVFASSLPATTRYIYDGENHLRFVIGAEGSVTEYRYNAVGQQVARLDFTEHAADVASAAPGYSYHEGSPNHWVAWMADKNAFKRTNTYYDARGNVSSVVSYSSLSKQGEGADSPLAIVAGAYTNVAQQPDGLYRITKTLETFSNWDAEAHSLNKVEGDFVLQLRPGQADKATLGGMSAAPAATADYTNLDYGFYFAAGGAVHFMEKGSFSGIGSYAAGDNFWLERVGSTINYYKGATFAAAKAAGAMRTRSGAAGALYFDSSIYTWPAHLDAALTPRDIVSGVNTAVTPQADGLYRVTKTSGSVWDWDADARSTSKAEGDFVLRLRPGQTDRWVVGGVSTSPAASANWTNADYGFLFHNSGTLCWQEGVHWDSLGVSYQAGDNFWLVRTGGTINFYKGATLEAAVAAGTLRTRTGASGTFYFDSSFLTTGASMDVEFMPSPIVNNVGTTVTPVGDGMQRIAKSGGIGDWDSNARSTTRAEADFVLHLRPAQTNLYMMGGVGRWPESGASVWDLTYSFYFHAGASLRVFENGQEIDLGVSYSVGENFWMVRSGSSIGYYRGATLEAAMAAGALRTVNGVSGTFHFDSSIHSPGAAMDVEFKPTESAGGSAEVSRTHFVYDAAGQLLSRVTEGQHAETFVYDGLGRMVASKDLNQGTTSIVFNDAANQTVVTLASGLVRTSTYNKAGNLISVAEGGSYVAAGTATSKYDKLGRLRMTTDATGFNKYFVYDKAGRLVGEVNHRGDLTEYRYDFNDRLIATTRYANAISAANLAALADPNSTIEMSALRPAWHPWDIWSWRTYDKEGRLTSTIDGTVRTYEYDKSGRLIKSVAHYNALSWEQALAFQANPPVSPFIPAVDPRDSVARNFYDREGKLLAALDGEGYLTRNVYDSAGQLIESVAYATATAAADRAGGTLARLIANQATHSDDRRTRFVYDGQGQLRFEIDALNQVTEHGYNGAGQRISTIRHSGTIPWYADCTYDSVKGLVAALRTPASPPVRKSWNVYDGSGRLAFAIDPEGAVSSFSYDNMGQVTKTVQFAALRPTSSPPGFAAMSGWAAAQSGNAANRVTRNYYNARGEARYTVDAEGYVSRTDFDSAGRTVGEYRWDNPISVNDASTIAGVQGASEYAGGWTGKTYAYAYGGELTDFHDGVGNWTNYVYFSNGVLRMEHVVNGDQAQTYLDYDNWGRTVARYEANGSPEAATTGYRYDGHGNLDRVVDPRNNATVRTFDHLGRLKTETDALGGVVTYEYNAFGDVTKVIDARGNATVNSYDALGRLKTTTDALNNVTTYGYDDFGDLRTVTRGSAVTSFDYDRAGRVIKTTDAEAHYELYELNAFGDRISVRNKIGGTTVNAYDRRGLLVAETLPMASVNADGATLASSVTNKFEYDSRGNRTKRIEAFGLAEARTTAWTYDKADRLIETRGDAVLVLDQTNHYDAAWAVPTETLKYDARDRVIEKTDALGGRTLYYYDKMSRVKAEIDPTGTYTAFTYDANGNMMTRRIYGTAVALPAVAGGSPPSPPAGEYRETNYTYDALNRLKTTSLGLVRPGAWNAALNQYDSPAWLHPTTTLDYDANGNVVRSVDGNGNAGFTYYDKLNRKIAEVDREGYLTYLTLDGEGNVVWDQRYSTPLAGVTIASDPNALRVAAGEARTTEFIYDRNGRRRFERRYGVQAYTVDPNGGALSGPTTVVVTIEYSYNGLGEVLRKTESNGDYVDYDYDLAGRLTRERRAAFIDVTGAWVRPTTDYSYNGLNGLTRTRQGGEGASGADRVTRYYYGAGGRLASMYDAAGGGFHYQYDRAGNVLRESYYRHKYAAGGTTEGLLYTRDQLGRVTSQGLATWNGSTWDRADTQATAYNAYGDVAKRGLNGLWQEQYFYDSAGRLWKSNSGDGVWRFFMHDGAGNRTLTMESEGSLDFSGYNFDQMVGLASANYNTYIGNHYADGFAITIAQLDRRGLQVGTRQPFRELAAGNVQTLASTRSYNAYGEVTSETDTLGRTTSFLYNAMGRLIEKQSPWVDFTNESGATGNTRPVEKYYYDVSGRLIATEDANGNRLRRALLAGTGHGGSEALVAAEFQADGGASRTWYDVFGDARKLRNQLGTSADPTVLQVAADELRSYDVMGRLTQHTHRGGSLTDYYGYDILGQRLTHWNTLLGDAHFEVTHHDVQGRITSQTAFGGDVVTTSYAWNPAIATSGMGTFGGWTETSTYANGRSGTEQTDAFGRQVYKSDLGGHVFTFAYDKGGRMTARHGGETINFTWFNTGKVAESYTATGTPGAGAWSRKGTTYGYDKAGNLVSEKLVDEGYVYSAWSRTYKNATATYDALDRLSTWTEAGSADMAAASTSYRYDLAGNIRHTSASYRNLDTQGVPSAVVAGQEYWYRYDSLNRLVTKGELQSGQIVRGLGGVDYHYNSAGQRTSAFHSVEGTAHVGNPWYDQYDQYSGDPTWAVPYEQTRREDYTYDAGGFLATVRIAQSGYQDNGDGSASPTAVPAYASLRASLTNDAIGRVTRQIDYQGDGAQAAYDRTAYYDARGNVWYERIAQKQGNDTLVTYTNHEFGAGSTYALGAVTSSSSSTYKLVNGGEVLQYSSTAATDYAWYDGAVQSSVATTNSANPSTSTSFTYDGSGALTSIYLSDGVRPRSVTFVNDANGQAVKRDEADNYTANYYANGDPHDIWYRFGGKQMGHVGNNGTLATDYATSIANRSTATAAGAGAFRFGSAMGSVEADFDLSGDSFTSYDQGAGAGGYTVRQGDTLESIAAQLWGDPSLWYKLAEANGLSGSGGLVEGRRLLLPGGVLKTHHNSSTFKPFDPAETIGELNPATAAVTAAKPKKSGNKCGVFGTILLVAIAVAVSVVTYGALAPHMAGFAGAVVAGAASGVAGSVVSQGFGVATGLQDKFSWKQVAMAGIAGGVSGGLGHVLGQAGVAGSKILTGMVRGAAASALTQGVAVAVGLQKKFDFAGVAAAGVGGGIMGAIGAQPLDKNNSFANHMTHAGAGAASAVANAATRTLINGTDFGDNLIAALPDIIGSTIGNMVAYGVGGTGGGRARPDSLGPRSQANLSGAEIAVAGPDIAALPGALPGLDFGGGEGDIVITGKRRQMSDAAYVSMAATQEARWRREERAAGVAPPANIQGPTLYNYRRDGRTLISTTAADFSGNGTPHLTDDGHWGYWTGRPGDPNVAWHEVTIGEMAQNAADGLYGLGKEFVLGAWDTAVSLGELVRDLAISGSGAVNPVLKFSRPVQEADARIQSRISNISFHGVMDPIVYGIDQALTHDNFRPAARALGGIVVGGGVSKPASVLRVRPISATSPRINGATDLPPGSFSVSDWSGYPTGVPRPQGPLRIVEGAEYDAARAAANRANATIRRQQGLVGQPVDVHEIQPVKFGGSPANPANKVILSRNVHRQQVTPWWNQLQRDLGY